MERDVTEVRDRDEIERFLRRDLPLRLYEIGDLDPFFWPRTRWFGLRTGETLSALVLLYQGHEMSTLLALERNDVASVRTLVSAIRSELPERFHSHLSPGLRDALGESWHVDHHVAARKMVLTDTGAPHRGLDAPDAAGEDRGADSVVLGPQDLDDLEALLERAYPDNWFDPRMLETGQYVGIRENGMLACVAGVHVYSPTYRVAALGNIATDPASRGRGLARRATAALCRQLLAHVDTIGLNVHEGNESAIRCYQRLGFETVTGYDEFLFSREA